MADTSVYGICATRPQAESAVSALVKSGFVSEDVSFLAPEKDTPNELATEKNTKGPEGTASGAATGGVLGGALGLLAGIGMIAIPGVGPFIAAGPIMGTLAGLGAGGLTGGVIGGLIGLGMPEYEAQRYEGHIRKGGILVSVHCENAEEIDRAKAVLKSSGADNISFSGEAASDIKSEQKKSA